MSAEDILKVPSAEPTAPKIVDTEGEPWNVLTMRAGYAEAMNKYAEVKEQFDATFPPPPEPTPMEPEPAPKIAAISAGRRIIPDPGKYIVDRMEPNRKPG